jgi:aryl-alcohol dehydrogenase-like predicted oxidoreductase
MQYRQLGNTGIKVSVICLGTMTWGEQNSVTEAFEQLDLALDRGVNFVDTAEMYPVPPRQETQGRTEEYLGKWLQARAIRDKVIIATKAAGPADWLGYIRGGPRLDRKHLFAAVDASLQRLGTDYIDLYQLHWPERATNYFGKLGYEQEDDGEAIAIEETLRALKELIAAGKVRYVGLSNETAWGTMRFLAAAQFHVLPRVVSVQNPYNLLNRSFEVGLAEVACRERTGLLAYSPLAFGVLSGKYLGGKRPAGARLTLYSRFSRYMSEQADAAIAAYAALAAEHRLDLAQMCLAYVNSRTFVTSNIIGATSMQQLTANLDSAELVLNDAVLSGIEAIHRRYTYPCP